jgi:hypothetical protein
MVHLVDIHADGREGVRVKEYAGERYQPKRLDAEMMES